ncbi:hypothetical protein [Saccharothrix variisporea]|uniref:Uncharacterized protein n=1 Tax=Saccharothrix variisporea TaxID=543527 RepID=A0A495XIJ0_9PSEU|nr:hypothetical protein [Saccharothrix variisporea]RKT72323.1 hypothetical protein DFJ66_5633 [Saccharothrix variisporea]
MTTGGRVAETSLAGAADVLAGQVVDALRGRERPGLVAHVEACGDRTVVLGAVRLVGSDLFAPHLLADHLLDPGDVEVVSDSFACFPVVRAPASHEQHVTAWRDWATATALLRLADPGEPDPGPPGDAETVLGDPAEWRTWSVHVAQLAPLALPGLGGPVVDAVFGQPLAVGRGVTRSLLRRDYATVVRLARWTALLHHARIDLPLDPYLLTDHLRLYAGTGARTALDLTITRRLLEAA